MNDKITITNDELMDQSVEKTSNPKIVICEISSENAGGRGDLPIKWYFVILLPVLNLFAICWSFLQRKYIIHHHAIFTAIGVIVTCSFVMLAIVASSISGDPNWKNALAQRANAGVVIVVIEDQGWFSTKTAFGTGVVIAQDRNHILILTNRHVVSNGNGEPADKIQVLTSREKSMPAEVVALPRDAKVDMALLRIMKEKSLEVLGCLGDFDDLKVGDEVVAIGHPNGLVFTMTDGIVSALRDDMLIQSSASTNPGNSGGPLLNKKGQIIGINTFIIKDSQGLNFAVRADYALKRGAWRYFRDIDSLLSQVVSR